MPLINLKCNSCGGDVSFDSNSDIGFCPCCGSKYIKETPVNNYTTNVKNTFNDANITIMGEDKEKLLDDANTFMRLKKYDSAEKKYSVIIEKWPQDYRGWYGAALAQFYYLRRGINIEEYRKECEVIEVNFANALSLCTESDMWQQISNKYKAFNREKYETLSNHNRRINEEKLRHEKEERSKRQEEIDRKTKQEQEKYDIRRKRRMVWLVIFIIVYILVFLFLGYFGGYGFGTMIIAVFVAAIVYLFGMPFWDMIARLLF